MPMDVGTRDQIVSEIIGQQEAHSAPVTVEIETHQVRILKCNGPVIHGLIKWIVDHNKGDNVSILYFCLTNGAFLIHG